MASALTGLAAAFYAASPTLTAIATTIAGVAAQFFPAVPLAIAGYILWEIYHLNDYENPDSLKKYQEEAKNSTLGQIFRKHHSGWAHKVITQEQFLEKLVKETQGITDPKDLEKYGQEWDNYGYGFFKKPSVVDLQRMHKNPKQ